MILYSLTYSSPLLFNYNSLVYHHNTPLVIVVFWDSTNLSPLSLYKVEEWHKLRKSSHSYFQSTKIDTLRSFYST